MWRIQSTCMHIVSESSELKTYLFTIYFLYYTGNKLCRRNMYSNWNRVSLNHNARKMLFVQLIRKISVNHAQNLLFYYTTMFYTSRGMKIETLTCMDCVLFPWDLNVGETKSLILSLKLFLKRVVWFYNKLNYNTV